MGGRLEAACRRVYDTVFGEQHDMQTASTGKLSRDLCTMHWLQDLMVLFSEVKFTSSSNQLTNSPNGVTHFQSPHNT